jgi:hypothetical protein
LQRLAWCLYPQIDIDDNGVLLPDTNVSDATSVKGYYKPENVYYKVGYWPDEYYRFGIVFVYNNNQLSPVFNVLGYDMNKVPDPTLDKFCKQNSPNTLELPEYEPDNYFFDKEKCSNSRGVVRLPQCNSLEQTVRIKFDLNNISKYIQHTNDLTN